MRTLTVIRSIPAPPERVFDLISDHAGYVRFRGIRRSELLREGRPPPNGVGAIRRVLIGPPDLFPLFGLPDALPR
jgi:hypothetical protein